MLASLSAISLKFRNRPWRSSGRSFPEKAEAVVVPAVEEPVVETEVADEEEPTPEELAVSSDHVASGRRASWLSRLSVTPARRHGHPGGSRGTYHPQGLMAEQSGDGPSILLDIPRPKT